MVGILAVLCILIMAVDGIIHRKLRHSIAERLRGVKFNMGTVYDVKDVTIFKVDTIVIYFSKGKKRDMRFLDIDQALDLLKTRKLPVIDHHGRVRNRPDLGHGYTGSR